MGEGTTILIFLSMQYVLFVYEKTSHTSAYIYFFCGVEM